MYPNQVPNTLHPLEKEAYDNEAGKVTKFLESEVSPLFALGVVAPRTNGPVELEGLVEIVRLARPQVVVIVELPNPTRNLPNLPSLQGVGLVEDGAVLLLELPEARVHVKGTPKVRLPRFVPVLRQIPARGRTW